MEAQAGRFGFRRMDRRDHVAIGEAPYRKTLEQFFGRMEAYRLEPEDLQTAVTGAVGLAWGVYLETFQEQGRDPPNGPGSDFPRCSPRGHTAGRWCCTTATSSLLQTMDATPRLSR